MQCASAMYSCFIRPWLHSSYSIKQAIWISFHYMISCCCQSSLAFGPLYATVLPKPPHVDREQDTNLMTILGRLVNILGRLQPLPYHSLSQGPLGPPRLDMTRYVYHVNKFSYLVIPRYIPDTELGSGSMHAFQATWEEKAWVSYLMTYKQVRGRHSCQGKE